MGNWYYVHGTVGHQGAGRYGAVDLYIYEQNIVRALECYRHIPSIKKSTLPKKITELSDKEASKLEREIKEKGLPIGAIKDRNVYFPERSIPIYEKILAQPKI